MGAITLPKDIRTNLQDKIEDITAIYNNLESLEGLVEANQIVNVKLLIKQINEKINSINSVGFQLPLLTIDLKKNKSIIVSLKTMIEEYMRQIQNLNK